MTIDKEEEELINAYRKQSTDFGNKIYCPVLGCRQIIGLVLSFTVCPSLPILVGPMHLFL
jgi:hypothetical protein